MQTYLTLVRRELAGFFVSMTGYVIIASAMFLMGLSFVILMVKLQSEPTSMPMTEVFYATPFFWLILLLAAPVITMRLFALEKFTGTFETLMTTPVSDLQVVLAKFTAAMMVYALMWLPQLGCVLILRYYTTDPGALDVRAIGTTYLGIFLLGGLFMSLGCFASALTRSQIIAAMISLAVGITFFSLSFLGNQLSVEIGWQMQILNHLAIFFHMPDFARGIIDTRPVVLYVSLTIWFLFLTLRVVESRRWR
jgi:ABC-2 type transport system permease protein